MPINEIPTPLSSIKAGPDVAEGIMSLNKDVAINKVPLLISLLTLLALSLVFNCGRAQQDTTRDGASYYNEGMKSYNAKDYRGFLTAMQKAAALMADNPIPIYNVACGYALTGNKSEAIRWLNRMVDMGIDFGAATDHDLDSLHEIPEFADVLNRIEKMKTHVGAATVAFTLSEKDLIPENAAYDPVDRRFFVSSTHKRKIVEREHDRNVKDFVREGQDGLWTVIGMKVDAKRRLLWVATATQEIMRGYKEGDIGKTAVFKYDLTSNLLAKKYPLIDTARHLFNDLALDSRGNVFITESLTGWVYWISSEDDSLRPLVKTARLINGVTVSEDDRNLFLGTYDQGLLRVDLKTKEVTKLQMAEGISTFNVDGIYSYRGSLLVVQTRLNRVTRFYLNDARTRIEQMDVLEANNPHFDDPTTGCLVGDTLYVVANCQFRKFDSENKKFPLEKLSEPVILAVKLMEE